jgi:hypothetical protein
MASTDRRPPVGGVIPIETMVGDDEEDTKLLRSMAAQSQEFLLCFRWCKEVREIHFGDGYGGVVAVFFVRIRPSQPDIDEWLWVVIGSDIPPAYLVIDSCKTPLAAFERYLAGIAEWIAAATRGKSVKDLMPIYVPATAENAAELARKLNFLRETVLPQLSSPRN